jgi:hypothetical protein
VPRNSPSINDGFVIFCLSVGALKVTTLFDLHKIALCSDWRSPKNLHH